jgi:hypothetical protein
MLPRVVADEAPGRLPPSRSILSGMYDFVHALFFSVQNFDPPWFLKQKNPL